MASTHKDIHKNPLAILGNAVETLMAHPIALFPLCITAFIQVLCLEIIFFAPREPLSHFFEKPISYFKGPIYLHYPHNFNLLSDWYHSYFLQYTLYIFLQLFLIGVMISILHRINNDQKIRMKVVFQQAFASYWNILWAAIISVVILHTLVSLYDLVIKRALLIRSTNGIFYILKMIVLGGTPYLQILLSGLVTILFAFVVPIIVVEKKNVFLALLENFKNLFRSFWTMLVIILIPLALYLPILILKSNTGLWEEAFPPEAKGILLLISIFILLAIDAIQYTAVTIYYLVKREAA